MPSALLSTVSTARRLAAAALAAAAFLRLAQAIPAQEASTPRTPPPARGKALPAPARVVHPIPQPLAFNFGWGEEARDPFIDPARRGKDALLATRSKLPEATRPVGYQMKDFVADLRTAGDNQGLKVQSVFPGHDHIPAVAVVNSLAYQEGDWIPVRIHTQDIESFSALAKSKGFEFERVPTTGPGARPSPPPPPPPSPANGSAAATTAPKGPPPPQGGDVVILLKMGRIAQGDAFGPGGMELRLPGYSAPLAIVPIKFPPRLTTDNNKRPPAR